MKNKKERMKKWIYKIGIVLLLVLGFVFFGSNLERLEIGEDISFSLVAEPVTAAEIEEKLPVSVLLPALELIQRQQVSSTLPEPEEGDTVFVKVDPLHLPIARTTSIIIEDPFSHSDGDPENYLDWGDEYHTLYWNQEKNESILQQNPVVPKLEYDECAGDSILMLYSATSEGEKSPFLFVKGITSSVNKLHSVPLPEKKYYLTIDELHTFDWFGQKYMLRTEGVMTKYDVFYFEPDNLDKQIGGGGINYKLYLYTEYEGVKQEQLLIAMPSVEYGHVCLEWIGDLDGDGKPDFVFNASDREGYTRKVYFLSSQRDSKEPFVGCVGICEYWGYC